MKARTKKQRSARRSRRIAPVTIGGMLREEFMRPLGITVPQLRAALPEWPGRSHDWDDDLRWLLRPRGTDEFLSVDLALALDRVFGCREGYWLQLWAGCAARSRAWTMRRWLAQVKPVGLAARRGKFAALGGSVPGLEDVPPPSTAGEKAVAPEPKSDHRGRKLKTTHQPADWAERELARSETHEIQQNPAAMKAIADHRAGKTVFGKIRDLRARLKPLPKGETGRDLIRGHPVSSHARREPKPVRLKDPKGFGKT